MGDDREIPPSPELFELMRKRAHRYRGLSVALRSSIRYRLGAALVDQSHRRTPGCNAEPFVTN